MPSADCVFPRGNRHLFWSHTRDNGARLQEDGLVAGTAKWVRDLKYERCRLHGDTEGVLQLLLDKVALTMSS